MRTFLLIILLHAAAAVAKDSARETERSYLRAVMPEALLQYAHLEIAGEKNIALVGEGDARHLGLHIIPGQKRVSNGIRAELSVNYPCKPGDTVRYAWRCRLPADFTTDAPKNRWWVIGQWHDQPDRSRGESWSNFPASSPPVALGLGERDGHPCIALSYGPTNGKGPRKTAGPVRFERDIWHTIAVVIHWSRGPDGTAVVYLDDPAQPVLTAAGPNMNNDIQHYLKLGMYRHPDIATDNWIYLDDLTISTAAP